MDSTRWTTNPRIVKAFIDKSGDIVQWLEEMGVTFSDYACGNDTGGVDRGNISIPLDRNLPKFRAEFSAHSGRKCG